MAWKAYQNRLLIPTPRVSDSVGMKWTFLTSSQVELGLPILREVTLKTTAQWEISIQTHVVWIPPPALGSLALNLFLNEMGFSWSQRSLGIYQELIL